MTGDWITYFWALLSHWAAFMTGGIPAAIFLLIERARKKQFGWPTFFLIFIVLGFVAASYETWRDEHVTRLQAEQSALKTDSRKTQLQLFYRQGRELANRHLPKDISPEDFKKYEGEANSWLNNTISWIQQNMGEAAKDRFLDMSGKFTFTNPNAVNDEHSKIINGLNNFCENLQTLIVQFDAWNEKRK